MADRIVIIDGNSLINRAYYAMQRPMMTKEGIYTQAIYGFINMLNKIRTDYEPEYMAVAWDLKAPTFRHKDYKEYKAGRKKMPIELSMQLPFMKDILEAMDITNLSLEGYEADDIIGTLAKKSEEAGLSPLIITGDKDALQLASDKTKVLITRKGISEFDLYDREKMLERYGLTPSQFIDLKGLMGDQSDNIPGIPGVGEKTGIDLLKEFGSIDELLKRTDEISKPKLRAKVEENAASAIMSRKLAEIITDVPIEFDIDSLRIGTPDKKKLLEIFTKLEFNSFIKKMDLGEALIGSEDTPYEFRNPITTKTIIKDGEALPERIISDGSTVYIKVFSDNNHIGIPEIIGISILSGENYYYLTGDETIKSFIDIYKATDFYLKGHGLLSCEYSLIMNGMKNFTTSYDSEIAAYIIDSSKSNYSIKVLAAENFNLDIQDEKEFYKSHGQVSLLDDNSEEYSEYGYQWILASLKIEEKQKSFIEETNLSDIINDVEFPLVKVLAGMEAYGFKASKSELDSFGKELKREIESLSREIYDLADEEFNINSTKQLGEILFEKLGLPSGKKTKTGYSTGAEVLEKIIDEHDIIPLILRYRMLTKLNSTYVDGLIPLIGNDDRIRAHFQQTVTATGRISCTEPNLQNIPIRNEYGRLLRKAFIPTDDNYTLVGADYSQIELRVLAHLAGDEELIEAFNRGDDIHRATASRVFDIPYDEVTSNDRSKAKAVNFGVIYGMSGFGLSEELGISRKEAEAYIKDYFHKHPKVKEYMDSQISLCKERGYTETLFGRRRYIPEINSSNFMVRNLGERLAMNSPIQGTAADIIKKAMILVDRELKEKNLKSTLILQVHDELIIDTLIEEKDIVEELLIRNMVNAVSLKVDLICDLNSGNTWYELK